MTPAGGGMARAWLVVAVVVWGACNPYRKPLLTGEIVEVCPGGNPERALLHFEKGGTFDWRYPDMKRWREGDDESWRLKKDQLTVSWNAGYAIATYQLEQQKGGVVRGTSTKAACESTIRLERTGTRTDR